MTQFCPDPPPSVKFPTFFFFSSETFPYWNEIPKMLEEDEANSAYIGFL